MKKQPKGSMQPIVALDPVAYRQLKDQEAAASGDLNKVEEMQIKSQQGPLELILKSLQGQATRLSFEVDPQANIQTYAGIYRNKANLTPDHIIKKIISASGDDLVCQILQARSNIMASFGRPRTSRFSIGFEIEEIEGHDKERSPEEHLKLKERIKKVEKVLWNCGHGEVAKEYMKPNFSQYMKMITRDGVAFGRFATEFIHKFNPQTGKKEFWAFRPVDAGTIYHIMPQKESDQSTRLRAIQMLERLKNEKMDLERYKKDEYKWTQVIDGIPDQAFSDDELVVYNLYPVTNVEYNGYPLTPVDQALNAITTHINITIHNKLYFQNGRASRGILVFKSDSIDEMALQKIRLQFHQSINSSSNSWRLPVFSVGTEDDVSWQPMDVSARDAEFQYLSDQNARVILSAFQMSPEELPGYAHLAKGTNTQSLSESSGEYKLTAARDVGLRPLMYDMQDFLNVHILPKIDLELSKTHQIVLAGLEKDDPEKESTRLQQDMAVHLTFNDIMEKTEKEKLPVELGGDFPLNPQFKQQIIDPYMTVGEILENFMGRKGATADPRYNYVRDQFWLQNQQILIQKAQMALQNQMAQQQQMQAAAQGQDPNAPQGQEGESSEAPPNDEQSPPGASETQKAEIQLNNLKKREEWSAMNYQLLEKGIATNERAISKMILARHKELVDKQMKSWENKSKTALDQIVSIAGGKKKGE